MKTLNSKIIAKHNKQRGQALVEMAFVLPLLLILVLGIIEFGIGFYFKNTAINISRDAARYAVVTPSLTESMITTYVNSKYGTAYSVKSTTGIPATYGGSVQITVHRTNLYRSIVAGIIPGIPSTYDIVGSTTMRYE